MKTRLEGYPGKNKGYIVFYTKEIWGVDVNTYAQFEEEEESREFILELKKDKDVYGIILQEVYILEDL